MRVALGALLTGAVRPLGPQGVPSGVAKRPVGGPVRLGREGFAGDAQGDRARHGGPDKAVHHDPFAHYASWIAEIGPRRRLAERRLTTSAVEEWRPRLEGEATSARG